LSFQPYSFDRFYRVERETPGNGLGLPIVERMVKMYGGNITAESELGKGTTFTISIPQGWIIDVDPVENFLNTFLI
jgi:two-component system phosphate regulon sensor histidine kinase PhoR